MEDQMKKYIGTKEVSAQPMTADEAVVKGYKVGNHEHEDGYEVEYKDGYKSWSPKKVFEESYVEETYRIKESESNGSLDFGDAIKVLKQGAAIRRKGWNGKGLFVIKQVPAHIEKNIIPNMQSLPKSAKDLILNGKGFIDYTSQCLIYNESTGRADSWVPSISDMFSEDWEIVK